MAVTDRERFPVLSHLWHASTPLRNEENKKDIRTYTAF